MPSPDYPSEIENVKGKNLLPDVIDKTTQTKNGITLTFLDNNQINLKGTSTATTAIDLLLKESTKITKDIYVHLRNNGTGSASIALLNSSKQFGWCSFGETNKISKLNGVSSESSEINKIRFFINAGQTIDITFQPSLEYTSDITRYVPYGNIQIVETGKNLFNDNFNDYTKPADYRICPINLEQGQTYTLRALLKGTKVTGYVVAIVPYGSKYMDFSSRLFNAIDRYGDVTGARTITIDETWTSPKLVIYANDKATFESLFKNYEIQLEKGSIATDYEPYKEEVVNIDLKGNELCSLPNGTKDELIVKDGRAKIVKRIGKVVLNGSDDESWTKRNDGDGRTTISFNYNINNIGAINQMNNRFQKSTSSTDGIEGLAIPSQLIQIYIQIKRNRLSTLDVTGFKAWLQANPVVLQYELETPEEIDLGEVSTLTTYEGTSNITNSEDAEMSIEYKGNKDLEFYIKSGNHFLKWLR